MSCTSWSYTQQIDSNSLALLSGVDLCRSLVGLGTCECGKTKANKLTQNERAVVQLSLPVTQSNV